MKKFMTEFKEFIARGDVMSMAVGIIIGGAFTAIVNSLVSDVITPFLGIITGGIDFKGKAIATRLKLYYTKTQSSHYNF